MVENAEYFKMLERMVRVGIKRASEGDEIELQSLLKLQKQITSGLASAVQDQNKRGLSWSFIGQALSLSKQNAFKKWGSK